MLSYFFIRTLALHLTVNVHLAFTPSMTLLFTYAWPISRVNRSCLPRLSGGVLATWLHSAVSLRLTLAPGSQVHVSLKYTAQKMVCESRGSCVYIYCSNELQTPVSASKLLITGIIKFISLTVNEIMNVLAVGKKWHMVEDRGGY